MTKRSALSKIGEFGFINVIKKMVKTDGSVLRGIGDDAAVLRFDKDKYLLLTVDMLIEGAHFRRNMNPYDIGHKALSCSISDIAAMGGLPKYAVMSVGLPKDLNISYAKSLYKGIIDTANKYKINLVGGDTNRSDKIIIDIALVGEVEKNKLVLRSKAKVGDLIFVTGFLGGSFKSGKHLRFIPRLNEARLLVDNYRINSMVDISDGLVQDLSHILEESRVGATIFAQAIPIDRTADLKSALYDGEDFELLFTISKKESRKLIKDALENNFSFSIRPIGMITDRKKGFSIVYGSGRERKLTVKGFRHF
ncbi:MAG: thiamine-phosphate kinase [Candidatus Omnitrophica bacterium]|nr:thiamine-phosphate kinase [Candidatus Omnitrophota bacterium]HOX53939.1 thiamine-phosphate kinase [Candidatus Omnitrophota bacterium]